MMSPGVCARDWRHPEAKPPAICSKPLETSAQSIKDGPLYTGSAERLGSRNGGRSQNTMSVIGTPEAEAGRAKKRHEEREAYRDPGYVAGLGIGGDWAGGFSGGEHGPGGALREDREWK